MRGKRFCELTPSLQTSAARKAAVGVVAGNLVIGIAEQTGAADRGYANNVAAEHGTADRVGF